MTCLLKEESFRLRVVNFIKKNLRSHLPGIETEDDLRSVPNNVDVAWSRSPAADISDQEYNRQRNDLEYRVVHAKQVHTCAPMD